MSEEPKKITGFRITSKSTRTTEDLQADEYRTEQTPTYVFFRRGEEIRRVAASDLAMDPEALHPPSPKRLQLQDDLRDRAKRIAQKRKLKLK